jgi:hypothetical protein
MKCDLRYACYDGKTWEDEKIPTGSPFCGEEANIALDSKNIPHVAFIDEAEIAICYAVKDGDWTIEQVIRPPGFTLAVGIDTDSNDSPHIVYDTTPKGEDSIIDKRPDRIEYGFWYAYKDGSEWKTEKITDGEPKGRTIAIDTLDIPHTAYIQEFENGAIYYAYRENGKWVSEKVTTGAMPNGDVDIDTDSANRPHLIYKNEDRNLIHAVKIDGSWHFETLREATGEQQGVRICIDNQDKLHVYYSEDDKVRDNMVSKYMYFEDNAWYTEDIAYGGEGDLSVGSDGIVHVCSGMAAPEGNAEWVRAAHRTGNR